MSNFEDLNEAQQAERLRHLALKALENWGIDDVQLGLIKIRENAVFSAIQPAGDRFVVRVHRANYHSDAELVSEFQWMRALIDAGIQTPAVIPASDGALFKNVQIEGVPEPRQVDVFAWVDGEPIGTIEEGIDAEEDSLIEVFEEIGSVAARMHNQAETWSMPEGFTRGAFDVDGLTGEHPHWGQFWNTNLLSDSQRKVILLGREKLRADLLEFGTTPDRFGLIHADLLPENFLVGPDATNLIDFDDAAFGWHLFDLSTPLFFHLGEDYFDAIVAALVDGYRKHRALPDSHLALLTTFLVARGTTYLGWLHTRPESETAKEMGPAVAEGVSQLIEAYLEAG